MAILKLTQVINRPVADVFLFERDRRVRIVPDTKSIAGGHRFTFTDMGTQTRVDHELEMTPKGAFKVLSPVMTMVGRRNLRATAAALQRHVERRDPG
jgi:hypothetical protein